MDPFVADRPPKIKNPSTRRESEPHVACDLHHEKETEHYCPLHTAEHPLHIDFVCPILRDELRLKRAGLEQFVARGEEHHRKFVQCFAHLVALGAVGKTVRVDPPDSPRLSSSPLALVEQLETDETSVAT